MKCLLDPYSFRDFTASLADPSHLGWNRRVMHAPWNAWTDAGTAREGNRGASAWVQSLDGDWNFVLFPSFEKALEAVTSGEELSWTQVAVPGCWQLQGFDRAIYTNIAYPFRPNPPHPPQENSTGCYRQTFQIPGAWRGRRVFLELGSAESMAFVWVNERFVGSSTDSRLPAEFELSEPGEAITVTIVVPRFSAGSYLEDQDFWNVSGLPRSVRLIAKPREHLSDYQIRTEIGPAEATVAVRAWMSETASEPIVSAEGFISYPGYDGYVVRADLFDCHGRCLASESRPVFTKVPMYWGEAGGELGSALIRLRVPNPELWTAETPTLYHLVLTLISPDGHELDWEGARVGIREVSIQNGQLLLNGKRLVIRGVNRHEWNARTGRALTLEEMREDVLAMKRLNFNAVRTSHYPNDSRWYDLCDELGLYVVDEANIETHGSEGLLCRELAWLPAFMDRLTRMLLRDRNHPSVIIWSLGNESFHGPHHAAMAAWARYADPTRPVQYESGAPGPEISDILPPMYPKLDWVRQELTTGDQVRPMILCEYAYARGNSTGNFSKFWDLVEELPRFQGGFVWEWMDKPIAKSSNQGVRWEYGEEEGERVHTRRMCLNGIVGPDRVPHPGAWEIKNVQAPVQVRWVGGDQPGVEIFNRYHSRDLSAFRMRWRVFDDEGELAGGHENLPPVAPGASWVHPVGELPVRGETFFNAFIELADNEPWAPAGHEIVRFEHRLSEPSPRPGPVAAGPVRFNQSDSVWRVGAGRISLQFDPRRGRWIGADGPGLHLEGDWLQEAFFRAPTDIDLLLGDGYAKDWEAAGLRQLHRRLIGCTGDLLSDQSLLIRTQAGFSGPAGELLAMTQFQVLSDGTMALRQEVFVPETFPPLPRIGWTLRLPGAFRSIRYWGRGPHENYPDRNSSALVGQYEAMREDFVEGYIFPQESGGRTDVRWVELSAGDGLRVRIEGSPALQFSALPFRIEDLAGAENVNDLQPRNETIVQLDTRHMGLGGDTGWSRNVHPEYLIPPGVHRSAFLLKFD